MAKEHLFSNSRAESNGSSRRSNCPRYRNAAPSHILIPAAMMHDDKIIEGAPFVYAECTLNYYVVEWHSVFSGRSLIRRVSYNSHSHTNTHSLYQ